MLNVGVPIIAAVNGPVLRHLELVLPCDIVLASEFEDSGHYFGGNLVPGDGAHVALSIGVLVYCRWQFIGWSNCSRFGPLLLAEQCHHVPLLLTKERINEIRFVTSAMIGQRPKAAFAPLSRRRLIHVPVHDEGPMQKAPFTIALFEAI
jgi:hypothetical protein